MPIPRRLRFCGVLSAIHLSSAALAFAQGQPPQAKPPQEAPRAASRPAAPGPVKAKPRPAAKPVTASPTPPSPVEREHAPSDARRLQDIEAALAAAELLEGSPDQREARKATLEADLERVVRQKQSLENAVQGGLDPKSVEAPLAELEKRASELRQQLAELTAKTEPPLATLPKPLLVRRLDALESSVVRLEQRLTPTRVGEVAAPTAPARAPSLESPPPPAAPAAVAKADDRFTLRSADGDFSLKLIGLLQVRFAQQWLESGDDEVSFSIPRGRAGFKGNTFGKSLKYVFLADFGQGTTQLVYYFADYTFVPNALSLRIGMQKRPFSRWFITNSEFVELVSPSLAAKSSGDAMDVGVAIHNGSPRFEYALGVFNGNGSKPVFKGNVVVDPATGVGQVTDGRFSNVPARLHPALVARLAYNHAGILGYSEADLEGGPLRFSLGTAGVADLDADRDSASFLRGTVDAALKFEGFSATLAGHASSKQTGPNFADRSREALGFYAQSGFVVAHRYEPLVRYAIYAPKGADNDSHEVTGGMSVYFHGHDVKWQTAVTTQLNPKATETTRNVLLETQFQLNL